MSRPGKKPYDLTAAAYVVSEGRVLLVAHRKLGKWLPPGGHVARDARGRFIETPAESAVREVLEETGYRVEVCAATYEAYGSGEEMLPKPESMHIHPIDPEHGHLGFDFLCRLIPEAQGQGEESWRWFTEAELKEYPPGSKPELAAHVKALGAEAIRRLGHGERAETWIPKCMNGPGRLRGRSVRQLDP